MEEDLPQLKNKTLKTNSQAKGTDRPTVEHQSRVFQDARCHRYRIHNDIERNGSYRVKYPHFSMLFMLEGRVAMQTEADLGLPMGAKV